MAPAPAAAAFLQGGVAVLPSGAFSEHSDRIGQLTEVQHILRLRKRELPAALAVQLAWTGGQGTRAAEISKRLEFYHSDFRLQHFI